MADTPDDLPIARVWVLHGRRLAVASGAAVALTALLFDVNLWMASLRGGLTCLAVAWVVEHARRALLWSEREPPATDGAEAKDARP